MCPENNGMLEFDIDNLPTRKCRELEEYVRKVKNTGRKGGNTPSSSGRYKKLNRQNSKTMGGYTNFKNPPQNSMMGAGSMNKSTHGSGNQPSAMESNPNINTNSKIMESSDSESKSSNSSMESNDDHLDSGTLQPVSLPQMTTPGVALNQTSAKDLYKAYQNKN